MTHTPTTPADERALRLIERIDVPAGHLDRLRDLVHAAQQAADGEELQAEFGKDAVALIVGCNQFVRFLRGGEAAGSVELLLDDPAKAALGAAGFELGEPEGQVFRLFGWVQVDPMQADDGPLRSAVVAAYQKAAGFDTSSKQV